MPYYRDIRAKELRPVTVYGSTGVVSKRYTAADYQEVTTSFRSRPLSDASQEVDDQVVDPHAYFVPSMNRETYRKNLEQRGITPVNPIPDKGHPFESRRYTLSGVPVNYSQDILVPRYAHLNVAREDGVYMAPAHAFSAETHAAGPFKGSHSGPAEFPQSDLANFGQRALAKTAPSLVKFDLGRALGELREGLPRLGIDSFRFRAEALRDAGSDYLNFQFGWLPLISDVKTALSVLTGATEVLAGLPEQGRPIRRAWGLPPKIETWSKDAESGIYFTRGSTSVLDPGLEEYRQHSTVFWQHGGGFVEKRLSRRQWFVGAYTTFYPLGFDPTEFLDRARYMMSIDLTPQVLWELTPWSWLIDWFAHIGDSIAANQLVADESLHLHYAYAMEETTARVLSSAHISAKVYAGAYKLTSTAQHAVLISETTWKRRIRANPFGFTSGGSAALSGKQLAILAALGLSRT